MSSGILLVTGNASLEMPGWVHQPPPSFLPSSTSSSCPGCCLLSSVTAATSLQTPATEAEQGRGAARWDTPRGGQVGPLHRGSFAFAPPRASFAAATHNSQVQHPRPLHNPELLWGKALWVLLSGKACGRVQPARCASGGLGRKGESRASLPGGPGLRGGLGVQGPGAPPPNIPPAEKATCCFQSRFHRRGPGQAPAPLGIRENVIPDRRAPRDRQTCRPEPSPGA